MEDFYADPRNKTNDFIKGFLGNIGIGAAHFFIYFLFAWLLDLMDLTGEMAAVLGVSIFLGIVLIVVEFILIRHFFVKRRYVAIGMLSSLILPLLVTGMCSVVFNGLYYGF